MTKMLRLGRSTEKSKIFKLKSKTNRPTKRFQKKSTHWQSWKKQCLWNVKYNVIKTASMFFFVYMTKIIMVISGFDWIANQFQQLNFWFIKEIWFLLPK